MIEPRWVSIARAYLGTAEIPGPRSSPTIASWLTRLRAWWRDDETPWCGVFLAAVMDEAGLPYPRDFARARAWLDWGVPLPLPLVGAVCVLERGPTAGHVFIVIGRDDRGNLVGIGGNQSDAVTIATFLRSRVLGYRWPAAEAMPGWNVELPAAIAAASTSEA